MRLASWLLIAPATLSAACFMSIPDVPGETGGTGGTTSSGGTNSGGTTSSDTCTTLSYPAMVKCHKPDVYYRFEEVITVPNGEHTTPDEMLIMNATGDALKYKGTLDGVDVLAGKDQPPLVGEGHSFLFRKEQEMFLTYVAAPENAAWSFHGKTTFTIEMWLKPASDFQASVLLFKEMPKESVPFKPGYHLGIEPDPLGDPNVFVPFMERGTTKVRLDTGHMMEGSTYHLVTTYDADGNLCLYLNAVGECVTSGDDLPSHSKTPPTFCGAASTPNAYVDELALYYGALTPAQIEAHYLAGTSP